MNTFREIEAALGYSVGMGGAEAPSVNLLGFELSKIGDIYAIPLLLPIIGLALLALIYGSIVMVSVCIRTSSPMALGGFVLTMLIASQVWMMRPALLSAVHL